MKTLMQREKCTPGFPAAPFTRAKIRRQTRRPPTDEGIKKMCDGSIKIYNMEYYSAINQNEILPFATTWMELVGVMPSEVSQTEKDTYHMMSLLRRI